MSVLALSDGAVFGPVSPRGAVRGRRAASGAGPFDAVVVGAGIVGLTCAVRLQETGARVAVIAADAPERTVSWVAAAVWYPTHTEGGPRVLGWARRTFDELAAQAARGVPGVVMRPTRMLLRAPSRPEPWWAEAVPGFQRLPGEWRFTVPTVEMGPYLHWLRFRVTQGGGVLLRRRLQRLSEVADLAPVVVNATGLAAGGLAGDVAVHPVRGRLVIVRNPGLFTSVRDEDNPAGLTYVHPRRHDVVLGGTYEPLESGTRPDEAAGRAILERCTALVPELAGATVLTQLVGLRPARHGGPRVEADAAGLPGGGALIHNYGHGGAGVTLGWGCADEVASLVRAI